MDFSREELYELVEYVMKHKVETIEDLDELIETVTSANIGGVNMPMMVDRRDPAFDVDFAKKLSKFTKKQLLGRRSQ